MRRRRGRPATGRARSIERKLKLSPAEAREFDRRAVLAGVSKTDLFVARVLTPGVDGRSIKAWLEQSPPERGQGELAQEAMRRGIEALTEGIVNVDVEAEVEEARMGDDAARVAFLERRTKQLTGQGNTTPVARRLAEAEWRKRGK